MEHKIKTENSIRRIEYILFFKEKYWNLYVDENFGIIKFKNVNNVVNKRN